MTNDQLAQAWARQEKPRSITTNKTFSFEGPTLYSYSTAIAWIDPANHIVFFSSTSYSVTTSTKHMRPAQWRTPDYYARLYPEKISTPKEMIKDYTRRLFESLKTLHRKKTENLPYFCTEFSRARAAILELAKLTTWTPRKFRRLPPRAFYSTI